MYRVYVRTYKRGLSPCIDKCSEHNKHGVFFNVEVKIKILIRTFFIISSILHLYKKIIVPMGLKELIIYITHTEILLS
jgi:hypothetical protein